MFAEPELISHLSPHQFLQRKCMKFCGTRYESYELMVCNSVKLTMDYQKLSLLISFLRMSGKKEFDHQKYKGITNTPEMWSQNLFSFDKIRWIRNICQHFGWNKIILTIIPYHFIFWKFSICCSIIVCNDGICGKKFLYSCK